MSVARQGWLAVITSGFPRRSETFLLNELLALDAAGALAAVFATRPGDGATPQPGAEALAERVEVLPPGPPDVQAAVAARALEGLGVTGVHGYFAHVPTAVAAATAGLLGVPYSFSVHARDARKVTVAELGVRARGAACVIACNPDVAGEVQRAGGEVTLAPHGVDLRRFEPRPAPGGDELRLLAVGRLVEKKGFEVLIEALRGLGVPARLRIVGAGPEEERLRRAVADAGLERTVEFCGPLTHERLPAEYAAADVVVAPSVADSSGDRDGLPNVVLEAMACGRPVVGGDVGALSSAVIDGETGLLVRAGDAAALRAALRELAREPERREALGRSARRLATERFDVNRCTARLHALLEAAYA
jgi:glycosyltransferase involved in cell wall biosynthesis